MTGKNVIVGAGLGMVVAYVFDPSTGRRRRALLGNRMRRAGRKTRDALDSTMHDVKNRASGMVAATRSRFSRHDADDVTLVERVRSKLGRLSSHPRALDVDVRDGVVTLRGTVLPSEQDDVLRGVAHVRGVRSVRDEMEARDTADDVPALQGARTVPPETIDHLLRRRWAPATQALVAAAGLATGVCLLTYVRR